MIAIFELLALLLVASAIGRTVLRILGLTPASRLERFAYSTPIGLGLIAYTVLALGLCGLLSMLPVCVSLAALTAANLKGLIDAARDLRPALPATRNASANAVVPPELELPQSAKEIEYSDPTFECAPPAEEDVESVIERLFVGSASGAPIALAVKRKPPRIRIPKTGTILCALVLLAIGIIVVVNCFVPPGAHEWDALSYHLAAPKVYLAHHRIIFLPTDHHSNFPFTVEMLFTLGLLLNGFVLANLCHFAAGALCVVSIFAIARRHFSPGAGTIAALVFASTPIVIWEAGAAYIEMGLALFSLVSIGAALEFRESRDPRWLALSGVLMGFALSVKALALIPFTLLTIFLIFEGTKYKNLRWYLSLAVIIGCPFYIKSWIWTGNPVYPYAYSVFGGKYWDASMAAGYASEQRSFGQNGNRTSIAEDSAGSYPEWKPESTAGRIQNAFLAPFELIAIPRIFYNRNDPGVHSHLGFLFLALPSLLLIRKSPASKATWLGLFAGAWFLIWSQTMQYVRYIVPSIPLLALAGGESAALIGATRPFLKAAIWAAALFQSGLAIAHFGPAIPDQIERILDPDARESYLASQVNIYESVQWLNRNTPKDVGVVLYEETRGFYLDRPYLWGNGPHSLYIPYSQLADGGDMVDWFVAHGIRYALLNLQQSQKLREPGAARRLHDAVRNGALARLAFEWYTPDMQDERWRRLLGDALHSGSAIIIPEACARAAVVIQFRPKRAGK